MTTNHPSDVLCPLPRRIERVRVSITSPLVQPSPNGRRVGIRIVTFEACSGFTRVTARRIAQPPKVTFVTRLRSRQLPSETARQLPDLSTIIRVKPSSTDDSRLQGALPISDFRFYLRQMRQHRRKLVRWNQAVAPKDYHRVIRTIRENGPITIRDIEDDVLVEKEFLWASRKPSKGALQLALWNGVVTISERTGMLKTYELTDRHFGWTAGLSRLLNGKSSTI